jgi:hypothetical protein
VTEKEVVNEETGEITDAMVPVVEGEIVAYKTDDPVSLYMNPRVFNQLQRVAILMAESQLVPSHLQKKVADCFLVCSQAIRWGMDPFAAAQHIYIVHGKVGWEGKIVAAIVNTRLAVKLNYEYSGKRGTKERSVVVSGTMRGEKKPREVEGSVDDWATANDQWKGASQIDQMLAYRGAREWARRYMPEAVLGVYSDDEVREIALKEKESVTDDTLDDLINPKKVTESDDPDSVTPPPAPEPEKEKETPVSQAAKKAERKRASAKKKAAPKAAEKKAKTFQPGDVLGDGRIVQEVDDKGQPTVVTTPKKEEPEKKQEASDPDDEIDALFS